MPAPPARVLVSQQSLPSRARMTNVTVSCVPGDYVCACIHTSRRQCVVNRGGDGRAPQLLLLSPRGAGDAPKLHTTRARRDMPLDLGSIVRTDPLQSAVFDCRQNQSFKIDSLHSSDNEPGELFQTHTVSGVEIFKAPCPELLPDGERLRSAAPTSRARLGLDLFWCLN